MTPHARFDVVVVGAGIGGLVAATLLARNGRSVLVVDGHSVAGGNATVFRRRGYEFDVGLHYIGGCHADGVIPRILCAAGVDDVVFEELDPDGYDEFVMPGLRFRVPKGVDRFRDRLVETFPSEQRGIDRYVRFLRELRRCLAVWPRPWPTLAALLRSPGVLRWGGRRFDALLRSCTKDPALRTVLAAQHPGYALPPSRASALVGVGIALHYLDGAYYPRGGGQVLADRLVGALRAHGGELRLRTRAERIVVDGGCARGVDLVDAHGERSRVRADVVVSNADLKRTLTELVDDDVAGMRLRRRAAGFEMAPALGVLSLGLSTDLRAAGHRAANVWVHPELDAEHQYAQAARGHFADAPSLFVTIASLKDPTNAALAPDGHTNMQAMGVAPSAPAAWGVSETANADGSYRKASAYRQAKQRFAETVLDTLTSVYPDIRQHVDLAEVATPLTQTRYTGASDGSSYGLAATPAQFTWRRPGPATPVRGLLLCGASCRAGHGIHGAARSGLEAAARLLPGNLEVAVLGRGAASASAS